jgi:hypothetical protein
LKKNHKYIFIIGLLFIFSFFFFISHDSYTNAQDISQQKTRKPLKMRSITGDTSYVESNEDRELREKEAMERYRKRVMSDRGGIPFSLCELKKPDQETREKNLNFIMMTPDPRAIQPLMEILKNDPIATLRRDAVKALYEIIKFEPEYKDDILPVLKESINDNSIGVQYTIASVLIDIGEEEDINLVIPILIKIFRKESKIFNQSLKYWAKNEVCRPDLSEEEQLKIADYSKYSMPERSLELLIKVGNAQVLSELNNCLTSSDERIKIKAKFALDKINSSEK